MKIETMREQLPNPFRFIIDYITTWPENQISRFGCKKVYQDYLEWCGSNGSLCFMRHYVPFIRGKRGKANSLLKNTLTTNTPHDINPSLYGRNGIWKRHCLWQQQKGMRRIRRRFKIVTNGLLEKEDNVRKEVIHPSVEPEEEG
ncbi:hypothetical protein C1646_754477 [Rhizophagus diaphanus]|nr:hypothetical protein C1646_754477 [Rhizophagus diaphanus] [Rhizophagus sp. MUCL 43196]